MIGKEEKMRIIGTRMPHFLASSYEKAARMVIDTYYVPTAEEIVAELHHMRTNNGGANGKILDLGTGPGYLPIEIVKRADNFHIDAIDPLGKSIRMARENAVIAGVANRIHFRVADATRLPFNEDSYDMIVSTGVLHELKNPVNMFEECYRVLKPGGKVFIHDPARVSAGIDKTAWIDSLDFLERMLLTLHTVFKKNRLPHTYSEKEAEEMIAATKFKEYQVTTYLFHGIRELKITLKK